MASPSPSPIPNGRPWQEVAAALQAHRDASLAAIQPPLPALPDPLPLNTTVLPAQLLTPEEVSLTETPPEDLLAALAAGTLTSTALTTAFLRRAALAQHATNCITELLPSRALARAAELDAHLRTHGKPVGALHGLPISVKEHLAMGGRGDGLKTNAGFCAWADHEAARQALVLDALWAAGAVFHARTTQPQTLMHLETSSNLFGATTNPFNRALSSGGSSGGEGALLGFRGSCLGVGSDIGGSVRSPAANCGVWGLRPTAHRLPDAGGVATMRGQEQIVPVVGPLSTSLEGVKVFVRAVLAARPWLRQADLVPVPWRGEEEWLARDGETGRRRLKVGVMWDDGVVKPHPPVVRALREVVERLKGVEGVEVVEWTPYKHDLAWEIIAQLFFGDGGREEAAAINASGEPWRPLSKFILQENPHVPKEPYSITDVWHLTRLREQYRGEYLAHWNATATKDDGSDAVDVILCPVGPGAAPPLDNAKYWGYTSQWNLLDYPALVFPVTQVDPAIDVKDEAYQPRNHQDDFNHKLYEPETYRDAPVSLQLVGRRFEDEKVVQAMEYIVELTGLPFAGFGVKKGDEKRANGVA